MTEHKLECDCVNCPIHGDKIVVNHLAKELLEEVEKDLSHIEGVVKDLSHIDDIKMGSIGGSVCG